MQREQSLSAVAWVGNAWFLAVIVGLIAISLIAFFMTQNENEKIVYFLMALMISVILLLTYPYFHYRLEHGYVKRIPPRFHSEKAYFTKTIEKIV
jgi:uncharacterized membrane protein YbhN (UPF0104 family)